MTALPEYALQRIGRHRIASFTPMRDLFVNNVWQVTTHDGDKLIVRRMVSPWAYACENAALALLHDHDLPTPEVVERGATLMIYRATPGAPLATLSERVLRQVGYALRCIHLTGRATRLPDAPLRQRTPQERVAERLPDLVLPLNRWCPTHGDLEPGNVLVGPDGIVAHLIDFETFSAGDPLVDLMLCCVAFATAFGGDPAQIVRYVQRGYFDGHPDSGVLSRWEDAAFRKCLALACAEEAAAWSKERLRPDRAAQLNAGGKRAVEALSLPLS